MSSEQSDIQSWRGASWERGSGDIRGQGGVQALRQAIMQDAREEVEGMLADARNRAESIRAQAEAEADAKRDALLQRARRGAEVLHDQVIAKAQMEAQTLRLKRREQLLERPLAEARRQLASAPQWPDYEQIVRRLVRDAAVHLNTDDAVIRADVETREALTDEVLAEMSKDLGVHLQIGDPLTTGIGIVLETPDGHRRYDNTLETRLARMQGSLRPLVYRILMGETP